MIVPQPSSTHCELIALLERNMAYLKKDLKLNCNDAFNYVENILNEYTFLTRHDTIKHESSLSTCIIKTIGGVATPRLVITVFQPDKNVDYSVIKIVSIFTSLKEERLDTRMLEYLGKKL